MPLTITCSDGVSQVVSTLSDDLVASIDQYRQTIGSYVNGQFTSTYPDIPSMFAGIVNANIVIPAMNLNPPAAILEARQALVTAQQNLAAAQAAAIPSFQPQTS